MPGRYGVRSLFSYTFPGFLSDPIEEFMDKRATFFRGTDQAKPKSKEEILSAVGPYLGEALEKQRQRLVWHKIVMEITEWPDRSTHAQWYAYETGGDQVYLVRCICTDTRSYRFPNLDRCSISEELWHDFYLQKQSDEEYIVSSIDVIDKGDCFYKRDTEYCKREDLELPLKRGLSSHKKQKEARLFSRDISKGMYQQIPGFSEEQFIAQTTARLKCIYYADNREAVKTFADQTLEEFIRAHQNVVNCEVMDFHFVNFTSDGQNYTLSVRIRVMLDRYMGGNKIKRKKETIKMTLMKSIEGIMNQDWFVTEMVSGG